MSSVVTNKKEEAEYMPFKIAVTFQNQEGKYLKIPKNIATFSADLKNETESKSTTDTCRVSKDVYEENDIFEIEKGMPVDRTARCFDVAKKSIGFELKECIGENCASEEEKIGWG